MFLSTLMNHSLVHSNYELKIKIIINFKKCPIFSICAVSESNNQAEISAFVQSYTECLQYTIKCMAQTEEHSDLKYLITEQVIYILNNTLPP